MKVKINSQVEKEISRMKDSLLRESFLDFIELLVSSESLLDISSIKKLSGYKNYYRYRIGDYRVGFVLYGDEVLIEKFKHRKDIYKNYP